MTKDGGEVRNTRSISENQESLYIVDPFDDSPATNSGRISQMKKLLHSTINISLTNRQKQVFEMYYIDGKKMPEIADILGVNKSSVYRALKGSIKKIEKNKKIFEKVAY